MATVFSCVASRNKRGREARGGQWAGTTLNNRPPPPYFNLTLRQDVREVCHGVEAASKRRCASGPRDQRVAEATPILWHSSSARPPRAANASPSPRTAILRIALLAFGLSGSPPAVSATSPVELQPAAWGGGELRGSKSRRSSARRGGKTVFGFPARRTSTAQFSAPCLSHCGSAIAPPLPSPAGISSRFCCCKTSEIPF